MEKTGKMWASIVRKDIPKYQKLFLNMHKKQAFDAKRFAEVCQREVCVCGYSFGFLTSVLCGLLFCISLTTECILMHFMQVKTKISRSLKWMRGAPARTRKLARDMLVFWKKVDKEQVCFLLLSCYLLISFTVFHCRFLFLVTRWNKALVMNRVIFMNQDLSNLHFWE